MHTRAQKPKATQQTTPAKSTIPAQAHFGHSREVSSTLHLQRTVGNQAVQRLLRAIPEGLEAGSGTTTTSPFEHDFSRIPVYSRGPAGIQTKLKVNTLGDVYEQEADRVSEAVMRMPDPAARPLIGRTGSVPSEPRCSCGTAGNGECVGCGSKALAVQRAPALTPAAGAATAPAAVHDVLRSPGQPLDASIRGFMGPRFGHDFSQVRVHADAKADASARAIGALAYTVGRDVVFGAGRYAPHTSAGRQLIAHELAHVLQQGGGELMVRRAVTYPRPAVTLENPILRVLRNEPDLARTTPSINGVVVATDTAALRELRAAFSPREVETISAPQAPAQGSGSGSGSGSGGGSGSTPRAPEVADAPKAPAQGSGSGSNSGSGSGSGGAGGTATSTECVFKNFGVQISASLILPTAPGRDRWGPLSVNGNTLGANAPTMCRAKRSISVTMKGEPDTASFYATINANEQEHVTDLRDASDQFLVPHYEAIRALRGRGQDSTACRTDLQDKLGQVPETRIRNFMTRVIADIQRRDTPGAHPTEQATRVLDDCNRMEMTARPKPAPPPATRRTP